MIVLLNNMFLPTRHAKHGTPWPLVFTDGHWIDQSLLASTCATKDWVTQQHISLYFSTKLYDQQNFNVSPLSPPFLPLSDSISICLQYPAALEFSNTQDNDQLGHPQCSTSKSTHPPTIHRLILFLNNNMGTKHHLFLFWNCTNTNNLL